jgi:hypothetical protein
MVEAVKYMERRMGAVAEGCRILCGIWEHQRYLVGQLLDGRVLAPQAT